MIEKLINKIKLLWYLFIGAMVKGDKILEPTASKDLARTQQEVIKEEHNVYQDLLKGEVTQEVRELRHAMYYTERKSYEYTYNGGKRAKKNTMFEYTGNLEMSDGCELQIVQDIKPIVESLLDCGLTGFDETDELKNKNFRYREKPKEYMLKIERGFIPRFRIEAYATRLVVKRMTNKKVLLDLYVSQYKQQFGKTHKPFLNELEKIYMGDKHSEVIEFNSIEFITNNAFGVPNLKRFRYENIQFDDIKEFDGSYVLRFIADVIIDGDDLIEQFYDEKMAEKYVTHAPRENASIHFEDVAPFLPDRE